MFVQLEDSTIERKIVLIFHTATLPKYAATFLCAAKEKKKMDCFSSIVRISIFHGRGRNARLLSTAEMEICQVLSPFVTQTHHIAIDTFYPILLM